MCTNSALSKPLAPAENLSIKRAPLMLMPAKDTALVPLQLASGITEGLLQLAMEFVVLPMPRQWVGPWVGRCVTCCVQRPRSRQLPTFAMNSKGRRATGLAEIYWLCATIWPLMPKHASHPPSRAHASSESSC